MILYDKARTYIYIFATICPIFIGYSLGEGVVFDASPFNLYAFPSLPIGVFIIFLGFLRSIFTIRMSKLYLITFLVLLSYLILAMTSQLWVRALPLFFGMMVPIANYIIITNNFNKNIDYFKTYRNICFVIVGFKFCFDILLFNSVSSEFFIINKIVIYNYFDYFPFIYCVTSLIIFFEFLVHKKTSFISMAVLIICFIATLGGYSRLYKTIILIQPLILFYAIRVPIRINTISVILSFLIMLMTIIVGLFFYDQFGADASLTLRIGHWHSFFTSLTVETLFFPIYSEYRQLLNYGTTHNELLEIYSLFGIGLFLFLGAITKIFSNVKADFRPISATILISLLLGTLIQLNFTNPYVGILWSTLLGLLFVQNPNLNITEKKG